MPSNSPVANTTLTLSNELSNLKQRCAEVCNIISNNEANNVPGTSSDSENKALSYVEGVRVELEASDSNIVRDENRVIGQFVSELNDKIKQCEELLAYKRGVIIDTAVEIKRLNNLIRVAEEAKNTKPSTDVPDTQQVYQKARERFNTMKTSLHSMVQSLFPKHKEAIMDLCGSLMQERLVEGSSGYLDISGENYEVIKTLFHSKIVTVNPYDKNSVRLAY